MLTRHSGKAGTSFNGMDMNKRYTREELNEVSSREIEVILEQMERDNRFLWTDVKKIEFHQLFREVERGLILTDRMTDIRRDRIMILQSVNQTLHDLYHNNKLEESYVHALREINDWYVDVLRRREDKSTASSNK